MSIREVDWAGSAGETLAYLCTDLFLTDMSGARALASAFEVGLVDHLAAHAEVDASALPTGLKLEPFGLRLLLDMLRANRVINVGQATGTVALTDNFRAALAYRNLLEAKLWFANQVAPDVLHMLSALLFDPEAFKEHARIFKMFSYQRAAVPSAENMEQTARWMRFTTALTQCETPAFLQAFDFSGVSSLLDVGGNSGEFALQICRTNPQLQATVYDLPVVCNIGAAHVAGDAAGARVHFVKRDPEALALPRGHDLITFKSMLHDWPDSDVHDFLQRAHAALAPGGRVVIFERMEAPLEGKPIAFGQWPLMLFFRSYRGPHAYRDQLESLGFQSVEQTTLPLDMPFMLMTAVKL